MPGLQLRHVGIYVNDVDNMQDFYTNTLGYTITDREESEQRTIVFMSQDPGEHHQMVLAKGRPDSIDYNLINQISLKADSLSTLKKYYEKVKADPRVTDLDTITHGIALSMYFRDPEGNRLEVYIDLPYYTVQPWREPFNFDQDEDAIWAEAEARSRTFPGFRPVDEWRADVAPQMKA